MKKSERHLTKAAAFAHMDSLKSEGYDPTMYKGHRGWVVEWWIKVE